MFGAPSTDKGFPGRIESSHRPAPGLAEPGGKPTAVRTVYDLKAQTTISWDPADPAAECGDGTFTGDWGDPFAGAAHSSPSRIR